MYLVRIAFEESRDYMHELYMYTTFMTNRTFPRDIIHVRDCMNKKPYRILLERRYNDLFLGDACALILL